MGNFLNNFYIKYIAAMHSISNYAVFFRRIITGHLARILSTNDTLLRLLDTENLKKIMMTVVEHNGDQSINDKLLKSIIDNKLLDPDSVLELLCKMREKGLVTCEVSRYLLINSMDGNDLDASKKILNSIVDNQLSAGIPLLHTLFHKSKTLKQEQKIVNINWAVQELAKMINSVSKYKEKLLRKFINKENLLDEMGVYALVENLSIEGEGEDLTNYLKTLLIDNCDYYGDQTDEKQCIKLAALDKLLAISSQKEGAKKVDVLLWIINNNFAIDLQKKDESVNDSVLAKISDAIQRGVVSLEDVINKLKDNNKKGSYLHQDIEKLRQIHETKLGLPLPPEGAPTRNENLSELDLPLPPEGAPTKEDDLIKGLPLPPKEPPRKNPN